MNQTVQTEVKRYLFMVVGCFSYALAFNLFLIPNNVVTGGVTGLSTLVNILCGGAVGVGIISISDHRGAGAVPRRDEWFAGDYR